MQIGIETASITELFGEFRTGIYTLAYIRTCIHAYTPHTLILTMCTCTYTYIKQHRQDSDRPHPVRVHPDLLRAQGRPGKGHLPRH